MKTTLLVLAFIGCVSAFAADSDRTTTAATAVGRVGVYDSRAVTFAYFWSESATQKRNALIAEGRAARAAHDAERFRILGRKLAAMERKNHLQVFSTEPADEAMAALADKLPALQRELDVTRFVSKWDEAALQNVPAEARVDVTDRFVHILFTPNERQQKTLEAMKTTPPIPIEEARKLADEGRM